MWMPSESRGSQGRREREGPQPDSNVGEGISVMLLPECQAGVTHLEEACPSRGQGELPGSLPPLPTVKSPQPCGALGKAATLWDDSFPPTFLGLF